MTRQPVISIIMSMLVLGAWHEISLRYLLWGAMHAVAISIWHRYEGSYIHQNLSKVPLLQKALGIFITIHFVLFSFIWIKEDSLAESTELFKRLFFI